MKQKLPKQFVYLVYCNKEPMVYAAYKSKQEAVRYALKLIRWRRERCEDFKKEFGFYHFNPFICKFNTEEYLRGSERADDLWMTNRVFSACLRVPSEKDETFGDDTCLIKVERMPLR